MGRFRSTLIAWSRNDRFFPAEHAERLATLIPTARLEWVEKSRTFSPEDRPDRLAELIGDFAARGARTPVASAYVRWGPECPRPIGVLRPIRANPPQGGDAKPEASAEAAQLPDHFHRRNESNG